MSFSKGEFVAQNLKDENGEPIVTLPPKVEIMVPVEFSEAERDFYKYALDKFLIVMVAFTGGR